MSCRPSHEGTCFSAQQRAREPSRHPRRYRRFRLSAASATHQGCTSSGCECFRATASANASPWSARVKNHYGKLRPSLAAQIKAAEDDALQSERSRIAAQLAAMQLPAQSNAMPPTAAPAVAASTAGAKAKAIPSGPVANLQPFGESAMAQHAVCPTQIGDFSPESSVKGTYDKTRSMRNDNVSPEGLPLPKVSPAKPGEKVGIPHPFIS
jgi:hypothetical protein